MIWFRYAYILFFALVILRIAYLLYRDWRQVRKDKEEGVGSGENDNTSDGP